MKGQAKKDFEEWFWIENCDNKYHNWNDFEKISTFSMQYGVIVDWFDSVEIYIEDCRYPLCEKYYYMINDSDEERIFKTRPQARQKAIEKAVEIYNNRFK